MPFPSAPGTEATSNDLGTDLTERLLGHGPDRWSLGGVEVCCFLQESSTTQSRLQRARGGDEFFPWSLHYPDWHRGMGASSLDPSPRPWGLCFSAGQWGEAQTGPTDLSLLLLSLPASYQWLLCCSSGPKGAIYDTRGRWSTLSLQAEVPAVLAAPSQLPTQCFHSTKSLTSAFPC